MNRHPSATESTTITFMGDHFEVTAYGGYDGFIRKEFDIIGEAIDYIQSLWYLERITEEHGEPT